MRTGSGFTLSELLIALVILGLIATFTIPKVLTSQQDSRWKSTAKETIAMISGAYEVYKSSNTAGAGTAVSHLTPYMNYIKIHTNSATFVDTPIVGLGAACDGDPTCMQLANGTTLYYGPSSTFGGTTANDFLSFTIDQDSVRTYNGDVLTVRLYFNGRIDVASPTPAWFSWN